MRLGGMKFEEWEICIIYYETGNSDNYEGVGKFVL